MEGMSVCVPVGEAFSRAFDEAKEWSGLGPYRMHVLWRAVWQAGKLARGDVLEVGAYKGGSALLLARAIEHFGVAARLTTCDTFAGLVKADAGKDVWKTGEMVGATREEVATRLPGVEVLSGVFPDQTGHAIAERTFRLAHVDVDTYGSGRDCWEWIWPRMEVGGIVVMDDCEISDTPGITRLVEELEPLAGSVWVRNHMGQALAVKIAA